MNSSQRLGAPTDDTTSDGGGSPSHLGQLVRDVHSAYRRALAQVHEPHRVSLGQWFFLRALWLEDGMTQRELSQRVGMMEPTTVAALNAMEQRGFVHRVRNRHDRRKVNIYLTAEGRQLQSMLVPATNGVGMRAISGVLETDCRVAETVLRTILANLSSLDQR